MWFCQKAVKNVWTVYLLFFSNFLKFLNHLFNVLYICRLLFLIKLCKTNDRKHVYLTHNKKEYICNTRHHSVQGVTRRSLLNIWGSRIQRTGNSFFYASATDGMWITSFLKIFLSYIFQKSIQRMKDSNN